MRFAIIPLVLGTVAIVGLGLFVLSCGAVYNHTVEVAKGWHVVLRLQVPPTS